MIGKNMEVYVDVMVVKSWQADQHEIDLVEAFEILRKFKMKLNSSKWVFGVTSGKYFEFMVHHRGIEANPNKSQVVLEMESPKTLKQL